MKAFISYSHGDEAALELVHKHLVMLKREGLIEGWHDRAILAGDPVHDAIAKELDSCDLFLPLVSPDFLNSSYCYDKEMVRAMERHVDGTIRVVPIIVEPCDWATSPLGQFKALPKDGKPISEWTNRNSAGLNIATELRRLAEAPVAPSRAKQPVAAQSASRYRIERDFDEIDRADYRDKTFQEIHAYFQQWIEEINGVEGLRGRFEEISARAFSCTLINRMKERGGQAHITVYVRGAGHELGDITYSFTERSPLTTANGWLQVKADAHDLFIEFNGFSGMAGPQRVSVQSAAQLLWKEFVQHAGVRYD
jgi:hypothetical protein